MKINYNYHTHTVRCGHAVGSDEEYILKAIKAGYKILGFSDHAPYFEHEPRIRMKYDQYDEYVSSIKHLKEKYKNDIEILLGLECEYYPSQIETLIKYRQELDYLLLGQHNLEHRINSSYDLHYPEEVIKYAKAIEKGCYSNLYDIVVHPDVFMFSYPQWDEACIEASNIIIDSAIANDIPLEVNCGGVKYGKLYYKDGIRYPYPHYEFFKLAKEKNAKIVLGLDIHDPQYFTNTIHKDLTLQIIKDLNLNIMEDYDLLNAAKKRKEKINKDFILNNL